MAVDTEQRDIITTSLGYQHEVDLRGPFGLSSELKGYHGLRRLPPGCHRAQRPRLVTMHYQNRATREEDFVSLEKRRQIKVRARVYSR